MLGTGLLKGLAVTAKNFAGSFHDPARYVTLEYPEQKPRLPENYRNFPFLVYDQEADPMGTLRCVACQICEKECPPQCIYIVMERDEKGKALKRPKVFDLDISVCMSCQICVEVCPFDAIKMDQHFEIAESDRFTGLLLNKQTLAKSNAYYHRIHPTEASAVDALLAEQAAKQAAAKAAKAAAAKPPAAPSAEAPKPPPPAA
jgi:NADH-quinone oxidoreductase subunit I